MTSHSRNDEHVNFFTPENDDFYSQEPYTPLDVEKREIRLLRLLPGSRADPLECEIVTGVFLSDLQLDYEAISYCAGDVNDNESIKVQGLDFNAFASLVTVLRAFRYEGSPRLLWTDQICIDQANTVERESQVQMMRGIYENAYRTLVCLGDGTRNVAMALAFSFIRTINDKIKAHDDERDGSARNVPSLLSKTDLADEVIENDAITLDGSQEQFHLPPRTPYGVGRSAKWLVEELNRGKLAAELASLGQLSESPHWRRCWIFQEMTVAKYVQLTDGTNLLAIYEFGMVLNVLFIIGRGLSTYPSSTAWRTLNANQPRSAHITGIFQARKEWRENNHLTLCFLLDNARHKESTDHRDRIYAFLGLVDSSYQIKADYRQTNTVTETFIDATKKLIEHEKSFDILSGSQEATRHSPLRLPSWVPDFSTGLGRFDLSGSSEPRPINVFDASGRTSSEEATAEWLEWSPPQFISNQQAEQNRVLCCLIVDLGPLAQHDTLGSVDNASDDKTIHAIEESWRMCIFAAGIKHNYVLTQEPIETAYQSCLSTGSYFDTTDRSEFYPARFKRGDHKLYQRILRDGWRFYVSPGQVMGIAPSASRYDDRLCILLGATVPMILRPFGSGADYTLVGPAYAHGYMYGEAVAPLKGPNWKDHTMTINLH